MHLHFFSACTVTELHLNGFFGVVNLVSVSVSACSTVLSTTGSPAKLLVYLSCTGVLVVSTSLEFVCAAAACCVNGTNHLVAWSSLANFDALFTHERPQMR